MRKPFLILMALVLLLCAVPALADGSRVAMQIISCPEQGFSTLCLPEYCYDYTPDGGLTIYVGEPDRQPYITIFKTDAPGTDFDAEFYFNNVYLSSVRSSYGSDLLNEGEFGSYSLGGMDLPGRMILYRRNGERRMRLCVYDLRETYFVRYEAFFAQTDEEITSTLTALSVAVGNFRPDPNYYSPASKPQMQEMTSSSAQMLAVRCPEQGFSVLCPDTCTWKYRENVGITIDVPSESSYTWVRICRVGPEAGMDPEAYFRESVTPEMHGLYQKYLADEGRFGSFEVAGRSLPGQQYRTSLGGDGIRMCVLDQKDGDTVRFEAFYAVSDPDPVLGVLDQVVESYRSDPKYDYGPDVLERDETGGMSVISCREQDFSTLADPSYVWKYADGGITIYTGREGSIPYVIVLPTGDRIMEPFEFIREQLTPHVRNQYGADLISVEEYESYSVGGKQLPAALYTYRLNEYVIEMLRVLDSTGERTVSYTAKYIQGKGDATLKALDTAVAGFRPSADGYPAS